MVNPGRVESLPGDGIIYPPNNLEGGSEIRKAHRTNNCPELAYVLKRFDYDNALLARLQINPNNVPLVQCDGGYTLAAHVREKWEMLETSLLFITGSLFRLARSNPEALPPYTALWPTPTECRYRSVFRTHGQARYALARSLDALFVLVARCSLAIALVTPDVTARPLPWIPHLIGKGVPPAWIDLLQNTHISNFSPGLRVGMYVDVRPMQTHTPWVNHVPCMIRANLPVYLVWSGLSEIDEQTTKTKYPFLRPYLPNLSGAPVVPRIDTPALAPGHHIRYDGIARHFSWSDLPNQYNPAGNPMGVQAKETIPHGPGQRAGESWGAFVARRKWENTERQARETDADRRARIRRTELASRSQLPRHPSRVYHWVTIGTLYGQSRLNPAWFELDYRHPLGPHGVADLWNSYAESQRRYDPHRDEWDLCAQAAPCNDGANDSTQHSDQSSIEHLDQSCASSPHIHPLPASNIPPPAGSPGQHDHAEEEEVPSSFADEFPLLPPPTSPYEHFFDPLPTLVRQRLDIVLSESTAEEHSEPLAVTHLARALSLTRAEIRAHSDLLTPLSDLVRSIPPDSATPLSCHALGAMATRLKQSMHPNISWTRFESQGIPWYQVQYSSDFDAFEWQLIIRSALNLLHLVRAPTVSNRTQAARFLSERGIPFRTVCPPNRNVPVEPVPRAPQTLGYRPVDHVYTSADYKSYEDRVRHIFQAPRIRAAVLCGGIVRRLALEMLPLDLIELAIGGPSPDVYVTGDRILCGQCEYFPRGGAVFDDGLSPDEMDVICGLYKVFTGGSPAIACSCTTAHCSFR